MASGKSSWWQRFGSIHLCPTLWTGNGRCGKDNVYAVGSVKQLDGHVEKLGKKFNQFPTGRVSAPLSARDSSE